jgi:hypothetical protein
MLTLKEQSIENLNGALYTCLERTIYKFYFSEILGNKFALCVFGEYAKWRKMY